MNNTGANRISDRGPENERARRRVASANRRPHRNLPRPGSICIPFTIVGAAPHTSHTIRFKSIIFMLHTFFLESITFEYEGNILSKKSPGLLQSRFGRGFRRSNQYGR